MRRLPAVPLLVGLVACVPTADEAKDPNDRKLMTEDPSPDNPDDHNQPNPEFELSALRVDPASPSLEVGDEITLHAWAQNRTGDPVELTNSAAWNVSQSSLLVPASNTIGHYRAIAP